MIAKERRLSPRFRLRLPLTVRWNDNGVARSEATVSQDLNSRGLYFHLQNELTAGSPLEVVILIAYGGSEQCSVSVQCQARVVRSGPENSGHAGVAARIERYEFLRNDEFEIRRRVFFGL